MSTNTGLVIQEKSLTVAPSYSSEQIKLLADTIAKGCDENELRLFIEIAKLKRLDPFSGQIRPVKRWNSDLGRDAMVIQVGIDGYRSTAARTNEIAGIEDATFDSEEDAHPKWAKVTVYRWSNGEKIPYTATARWGEYVQKKRDGTPNSMWTRMPYLMLAKCAEALALRKAFPDVLAGMYTEEEMGQADNLEIDYQPVEKKTPVSRPKRASEKQAEQPKAETQPVQEAAKPKGDGTEVFGGVIQPPMRSGKENCQWMHVMTGQGAKLIVMSQEKVAQLGDDLRVGAYLTVKGLLNLSSNKVGPFYEVTAILENPPEAQDFVSQAETEEVIDAEFEEVPENMDAEPPEETPTIEGLKSAGMVTTASKLPTGKVIGLSRAKHIRITASINNKEKGTGFTDKAIEALLQTLNPPLEHLRDLPEHLEAEILRYANGESDGWKKLVGG